MASASALPAAAPMLQPSILLQQPLGRNQRLRSRRWDAGVPHLLQPVLRAYLLAYASTVAPKIVSLVVRAAVKIYRRRKVDDKSRRPQFLLSLRRVLIEALHWQRFPAFCATLVGGSTLLQVSPKLYHHPSSECLDC